MEGGWQKNTQKKDISGEDQARMHDRHGNSDLENQLDHNVDDQSADDFKLLIKGRQITPRSETLDLGDSVKVNEEENQSSR